MSLARRVALAAFFFAAALTAQGGWRPSAAQEPSERPAPGPAFDPNATPEARTRLAPYLFFGGSAQLEYELVKDMDLRSAQEDDQAVLVPELSLALAYHPPGAVEGFLDLELEREFELAPGEAGDGRVSAEVNEVFVLADSLLEGRLSLQAGRQRFRDDRQWLLDERLDAVRALVRIPADLEVELALAHDGLLLGGLPGGLNDDSRELLLRGTWEPREELELSAYAFRRDMRSEDRERLSFFAVHAEGDVPAGRGELEYWLDMGHVRGRDGSLRVRGNAIDLGATYALDLPLEPALTLGYASGSGDDDPEDDLDASFRQSGLHDNEDRFDGVVRFRYYGELFDPELSNLRVLTGGIGVRPTPESSVDLVVHAYRQHEPAAELRDAGIDAEPNGLSRDLGREVDLVVGYREISDLDLALMVGWFAPGPAFGSEAEGNFFTRLEMQLAF